MTVALPMTFEALGTTAVLITDHADAACEALEILCAELAAIEGACSRFRADSELVALNEQAGRWTTVSPLLFEVLLVALRVCEQTDGAVDPTVARSVRLVGYDDDFGRLDPDGPPLRVTLRPAPGVGSIEMDRARRRVLVPVGTELDVGATAKAFAADRAARQAARCTGAGVLVGLGGDLSVAGPPPVDGWAIRVTDDHRAPGTVPARTSKSARAVWPPRRRPFALGVGEARHCITSSTRRLGSAQRVRGGR